MLLFLILIVQTVIPVAVAAEERVHTVVRVGFHEPPYFIVDENGRKSGYSYEYQRKVAAYTGWEYEYVYGTWSELMQMLKKGEIDLMSDVSYSEERTKDMLFSSLPMGTEVYYVFTAPGNTEITADNISALNGRRVGVARGSIQKEYFIDWAEKHGIQPDIVELGSSEEESLKLLGTELDAFVTMDVYGTPDTAVPVCKVGSSDFYFAVSRKRPELLNELDAALNKIQDENKYFDQQLHDKYLRSSETDRFLNTAELEWLASHGAIRIGYQDNYLAFCATDPATGELTGALKDYLEYASSAFENAALQFEPVAYPTAAAALEALQNGEIDCMFPANLSDSDAEMLDLVNSAPLMQSEMEAIVRAPEQKQFLLEPQVTVAVNEGNTNYDLFLTEHYPEWERAYFTDTPTALEAVADHEADCIIISNYRYSNISKQCEKLHLATVYTGVEMDYCFASRQGDTELYTILATITNVVPDSAVHTALTYYSTEEVRTSFLGWIRENLALVLAVISVILIVMISLLLRNIRANRKVAERESMVKTLNRRVFVDALTSVRNKGAYTEYIQKLQDYADHAKHPEFAIGIFDCNDLKSINDNHGHDKGDVYLKAACQLICKVFEHSPVFRIGGDEFAVILQNSDFQNREALIVLFEERRKAICEAAVNQWDEVHIAHGIAVYDPQLDGSVSDTARRADSIMYENKRTEKALQT